MQNNTPNGLPDWSDRLDASFWWLNWTQFQGALNDNIFKLLATFYLIRHVGEGKAEMVSGLGGILFSLPFILFIPAAGILADRFRKSRITQLSKIAELVVMLVACLVFWSGHPWMIFAVLFLMSTQSAFFSPSKYGIIPELVETSQLSRANGYLVSLTYLSIIAGTVLAPWLTAHIVGPSMHDREGSRFALAALACVAVAGTGIFTSLKIRQTPVSGRSRRASVLFWRDVVATIRAHRQDRLMMLAILASAYFSLIGAFLQLNLIPYAMEHLALSEIAGGYLFLFAAFGIGAGSLLAGRFSRRNIEFGIIPLGALMIGLATILLFLLPYRHDTTRALVFLAGVGAGLFIIPVEAFIQYRAPRAQMGSIMAANGFLSWVGVLLAGVLMFALSFIPFWQAAYTFLLLGGMTLLLTAVCLFTLPDFLVRCMTILLVRPVLAIRRIGLDQLPGEGGGLLVANHVSILDPLLVLACQQRRIRFLCGQRFLDEHPWRWLLRRMHVRGLPERDDSSALQAMLQQARADMDLGYLVCLFAEGAPTRTGHMRPFRPMVERLVSGTNHPVIPVHLGGIWNSRFSAYRSMFEHRPPPRCWRVPVSVAFGAPLPPTVTTWEVQAAIRKNSCAHFDIRRGPRRSMAYAVIRSARRHFRQPALDDTTGRALTHGKTLIAALMMARLIRRKLPAGERHVGVVLPPSVGGVVINLGLMLAGKVPVNLNFTTAAETFDASLAQAGIRTVITATKVMEKVTHLHWPGQGLWLADTLKEQLSPLDKVVAIAQALCWPARWLTPAMPANGDDTLTIIFSSGTTGDPKGVVLSHHNVLSNIEAVSEVIRPDSAAHLCAALPLFHSFGFTAGMCLPLVAGFRVSYHASPLDAGQVIDLIKTRRCNLLFSTSTFLSSYARKAEPDDLASLKMVVLGAEKMKKHVADYFQHKFGVRPVEGYGTTELSPVVSINLPAFLDDDRSPVPLCHREGSIGLPLPGISVEVADIETGERLPPGREGMLLVRGPNLMRGYLNKEWLTSEVIHNGWYTTGDIAKVDADGFIFITDRLLRFSKIAGEMVPHGAAEDVLASGLKVVELSIAVTAVPDEKKGERLVLLYTDTAGDPAILKRLLDESNLPNLWRPAENYFLKVNSIPITPTGKLDVRAIKNRALELVRMLRM